MGSPGSAPRHGVGDGHGAGAAEWRRLKPLNFGMRRFGMSKKPLGPRRAPANGSKSTDHRKPRPHLQVSQFLQKARRGAPPCRPRRSGRTSGGRPREAREAATSRFPEAAQPCIAKALGALKLATQRPTKLIVPRLQGGPRYCCLDHIGLWRTGPSLQADTRHELDTGEYNGFRTMFGCALGWANYDVDEGWAGRETANCNVSSGTRVPTDVVSDPL